MASANIKTANSKAPEKVYLNAYAECGSSETEKYLENQVNAKLRSMSIAGRDLKIKCNTVSYDEGNRFARYMIGFGAGAASSVIDIRLIDDNGNEINKFEITTKLSMGAFGGSDKNMLDVAADKIVKHIKENYIK
ncbi:DUF4410 domain-containing protein [Campylobacter sp. MG1]|uniref:DUF4410 domain-containing protein n=1 Tax=Campylobacter sp. MG1 TaxID=2976332 RepID=UPI00226CB123|nr:DUF4410 domain-containing protein [Campylobacter sp. MG1]